MRLRIEGKIENKNDYQKMNNNFSGSQSLHWIFGKQSMTLKNNEDIILVLKEEKINKASFQYNGTDYIIRNEGFWNPKTIIESRGKQVLTLSRQFWGSKAEIFLENGRNYTCGFTNSPLVKLSFFNEDNNEILSFKLKPSLNPDSIIPIMSITPNNTPEDDMILLNVLGCFSFKGIVKENQDSDLIIMIA